MQNSTLARLFGTTGVLFAAVSASAITFSHGDINGSFDTTISVGGIYRLDDPNPDLYGTSNGGNANSVNTDDGNLNFEKGWVSQAVKVTADFEYNYAENFSFFTRGFFLFDDELANGIRPHRPLTDEAKDHAAERFLRRVSV